jgi:broad specificity phosphatase PhoE
MKLYLVRHGETDVNRILGHGVSGPMHNEPVTFVPGGDTNVPLNVYGRTHAWEAGGNLPDHIDKTYCSPLLRTKETAEIVLSTKGIDSSQIEYRDELLEYNQGAFEGVSTEGKKELLLDGQTCGSASMCTYDYTPWGGDSWKTIHDRLNSFFAEIQESHHDNETVLCVTSGGVIRMTYKIFFSEKSPSITKHIMAKNGSVHEFIL